jgi:signal transduction histidine kinase
VQVPLPDPPLSSAPRADTTFDRAPSLVASSPAEVRMPLGVEGLPSRRTWAVSRPAAAVAALLGAVALVGWVFGLPLLTSVLPGLRVMVPTTSVVLVLLGASGVGLLGARPTHVAITRVALGVALLFAGATLGEYATGRSFGVEHWLGFRFPDEATNPFAGRMSSTSAFVAASLAIALFATTVPHVAARVLADAAAIVVLVLGWLALLGYTLDPRLLQDAPRFPGMALHTVVATVLLGAAVLLRPSGPAARQLARQTPGGLTLRRLLPTVFGIPLALGVLNLAAVQAGLFEEAIGAALLAMVLTLTMAAVIWANARRLDRLDADRRRADAALRTAYAELDRRVEARTSELGAVNAELERQMHEKERALHDAEQADRLKDEFLATVSHELRTPLHAMLGWIYLLREQRLDDDGRVRALATIERSAQAQRRLVEDLLDVSRIASGTLRLHRQPVDSAALVRTAIEAAAPAIAARRLQVSVDIHDGPALTADPDRLLQVITNLLSNAVKFTREGGRITITHRADARGVELTVADDGIGIAPEFLPHVFGLFRQADGSSTRKHGGLGLGLAIARRIVDLHGGTIRVESDGPGKGARFIVALPQDAAAARRARPAGLLAPPAASASVLPAAPLLDGCRVLAIDDDPIARELTETILTDVGAEVRTAAGGLEGLRELSAWRPDVVLVDLEMPDMDGLAVARAVRSGLAPGAEAVPLVALTAYARAEDRARALAAGFTAHVAKPVEPAALAAAVASAARRV